jgi:hypothetical protein
MISKLRDPISFTCREPKNIVGLQYTAYSTYCNCDDVPQYYHKMTISHITQVAYYMGTETVPKTSVILRDHCDSKCGEEF